MQVPKFSSSIMKAEKIQKMIFLSFFFFLLELIFGYISGSIALIADSFHMLSDVASLIIALYSHKVFDYLQKLAKSRDFGSQYSYGYQRAEVLGALVNGVSLLALCFTLIIEATQRLVSPQSIFVLTKKLKIRGQYCMSLRLA